MSEEVAKQTLLKWSRDKALSNVTLSDDGTQLGLGSEPALAANQKITLTQNDKSISYTLASIYLQIRNPDQGLVVYRNACKKYSISDPVKALDKPVVVGTFLGDSASAPGAAPASGAADGSAEAPKLKEPNSASTSAAPTRPSSSEVAEDKERSRKRSHSSDKHRHDRHHKHRSSSKDPSKKHKHDHHRHHQKHHDKKHQKKKEVTNEQLFSNLNVVVDKRQPQTSTEQKMEEDEVVQIQLALSADGFQVTKDLLQQNRATCDSIMKFEIPVGNSASILRAATVGADLTRVLNLYSETLKAASGKSSSASTKQQQSKNLRSYLIGKKPVIIVPKGMTAPITMINAYDFFEKAVFVPRQVAMRSGKKGFTTKFKKKLKGGGGASAGGLVEFELVDNPRKLVSKEDWERVVAVIVLGHSWQFKDWPGSYKNPVHLFSRIFGFYIGMEGDKLPTELVGWSVKQGKLHRDKRGLDSVTHASFWNHLDQWMAIHKPELLIQNEEG